MHRHIANGNPITLSINVLRESRSPYAGYSTYAPEMYLGVLALSAAVVVAMCVQVTVGRSRLA